MHKKLSFRKLGSIVGVLALLLVLSVNPVYAANGDSRIEIYDYNAGTFVVDCNTSISPCNVNLVSGHAYMIRNTLVNVSQADRLYLNGGASSGTWGSKSYDLSYNGSACSGGTPDVLTYSNVVSSWGITSSDSNNCIYYASLFGTATSSTDGTFLGKGHVVGGALKTVTVNFTTP